MPNEWLPPDPNADEVRAGGDARGGQGARAEAAPPSEGAVGWRPFTPPGRAAEWSGFAPPTAPGGAVVRPTGEAKAGQATSALALGAGALGLLAFTAGMLFFLTLPASVAGWVMGSKAKAETSGRDQANVAVIIGIVGTVLGVVAAVIWIIVWSTDIDSNGDSGGDGGPAPPFDVVRAVTARR